MIGSITRYTRCTWQKHKMTFTDLCTRHIMRRRDRVYKQHFIKIYGGRNTLLHRECFNSFAHLKFNKFPARKISESNS